MTRPVRKLLSSLSMALVLLGAGGSASAEEIVWWSPNWGQARAEELIKKFEAANPDVKVKLDVTVSNGLQNRIQVALRSGSPPDLIDSSMQWTVPFANTGKLLPLDDFVAKSRIDLGDFYAATLKSARHEGKLYGLPYRAQTLGLLYNKQHYRDAGLDPEKPPQTWDEFIKVSQQLTKKNSKGEQQYGFGVVGGGEVQNIITRLMPFIWMNGGTVISDDEKRALVNQPEAVQAVEFYTSPFTKLGVSPPSTLQNDGAALRKLFSAGAISQYLSGQYDLPAIKQENPEIEVGATAFPHPAGKQTSGVLSGWNFIVPKDSKHIDAALRLAGFLVKPENMGYYTDTFPATKSAMKLPRFDDPPLQPFKDMLQYTKPAPSHPAWVRVVQIMYDSTQEILLKRTTPQAAMDEANKKIQALLDK